MSDEQHNEDGGVETVGWILIVSTCVGFDVFHLVLPYICHHVIPSICLMLQSLPAVTCSKFEVLLL